MITDLLDWHDEDEPAVDPEAEYRMLLNGLRRTQGFGLFFVECSPFGGAQIMQRVRTDLAEQAVAVLKLEAALADGNVYKSVHQFLAAHPATQILFIQGLELSLLDYEESKKRLGWSSEKIFSYSWHGVPPVLINLNQQRERFRDSFTTRFVFLLPAFAVKYLVHRAPDFFDWRSGIAQFRDDRDTLSRESQRIRLEGFYTQYLQWSQAQRNRRILEIQSLLEADLSDNSARCNLYFEQGNLFAASMDWIASLAAFDAALMIQPDYYEALNNKGNTLGNLRRYEDAITAFDAALNIKPDFHEALSSKGLALLSLGRYEEAIAAYDAALALKPDKDAAHYNKGNALGNLGRYEEAIAAYDAALAIKPDKDEAHYNKGIALSDLGRYEEAIAAYDAALAIQPDKYEAWGNRGIALTNLERFEEALNSYDQVLAIKPDDDYAVYKKACCYSLQGQVELAVENLGRAIQLNPDEYRELAQTDTDFDAIRDDPRFQALFTVDASSPDSPPS